MVDSLWLMVVNSDSCWFVIAKDGHIRCAQTLLGNPGDSTGGFPASHVWLSEGKNAWTFLIHKQWLFSTFNRVQIITNKTGYVCQTCLCALISLVFLKKYMFVNFCWYHLVLEHIQHIAMENGSSVNHPTSHDIHISIPSHSTRTAFF